MNHFSDIAGVIALFLLLTLAALLFLAPSIIAYRRRHPQFVPLLLVNLLLGWMFIPWVITLAIAFQHIERKKCKRHRNAIDRRKHKRHPAY